MKNTATTSIASLNFLGDYATHTQDNQTRLALLDCAIDNLLQDDDISELDVLLLPGGSFYVDQHLGKIRAANRDMFVHTSAVCSEILEKTERLNKKFDGVHLVFGIDSRTDEFGIEQLTLAFNKEGLRGWSRKLFPTVEESAPSHGFPSITYFQDVYDPMRFISLCNGKRAILNTGYDVFTLSDVKTNNRSRLRGLRFLDAGSQTDNDERALAARQNKSELFCEWEQKLYDEAPDVSLTAIHNFDRPERSVFYQRHAIASASAALEGGLSVASSHYRNALPKNPRALTLASNKVPFDHLSQGSQRKAHCLIPEKQINKKNYTLRLFKG